LVIVSKVRDEISLGEDLGKQGREARERGGFEATFIRNVTIKVC
jgi:hypothetical protein